MAKRRKKRKIELIPGGLASKTHKTFDPEQLQKGIKVEMEHTTDPRIAREIATDHLTENPKYYDMLAKIEHFVGVFFKLAQDPNLNTPNITIQPGKPEAQCALEILKLWKPDYFVGVLEIVIGPSPNYGHVQSGPDKDPTVIYINADRIITESGGQQQGKSAALACAKVIAHEKGHVASFSEEQGFMGGETPAQNQETEFENWLNAGGLQRVQSLPCFKSLPG